MDPTHQSTRDAGGLDGASTRGRYRVIVRVRPPNSDEAHEPIAVTATSGTRLRALRSYQDPLQLTFDQVFGPDAEQAEIFPVVRDVVDAVVKGRSSTILAYGQTGSGKTHTMTGPATCAGSESAVWQSLLGEQRGIIPRTLEHLFFMTNSQQQAGAAFEWQIHVSFMEIYNERVFDLLTGPQSRRDARHQNALGGRGGDGHTRSSAELGSLEIAEAKDGTVSVPGVTVVRVGSLNEVLEVLRLGTANRTYGDNGVNPTSSRSHAIFQVCLEKLSTVDELVLQSAKLNLVDLAGSEKLQPTDSGKVSGVVLQELTAINLSLSTLGKCIAALVDAKRSHVPCRDSKLTRLLSDAFRGQSLTAMLICIAPTAGTIEETLSSLKFADRAKRAVLDQRLDPQASGKSQKSQAQVAHLLSQVNELTTELNMERAERTRLQSVIEQNANRDASMSAMTAATLSKHKKHSEMARYGGGVPCFGDSPDPTDLDPIPVRMRDIWDSDEELGQCSDHGVDAIKESPLLTGLRKGIFDCSPGESVGASSYAGSVNSKPMSHFLKRRVIESSPGDSVDQGSHCGSINANSDSCDNEAHSKRSSGTRSDQDQVGDHMANIDSRLKLLTGLVSDQGEELKKRLASLEVLSVETAAVARTAHTLPQVPKEKSTGENMDDNLENEKHSRKSASKLRGASLQKLRAAADDPNLPTSELHKLIDDARVPVSAKKRQASTDKMGATHPSASKSTFAGESPLDASLRMPSHPSQPSQRSQAPQRSLPPQPSELPQAARPPQPPRKSNQPRVSESRTKTPPRTSPVEAHLRDGRSKTPPRGSPQDVHPQSGSPMPFRTGSCTSTPRGLASRRSTPGHVSHTAQTPPRVSAAGGKSSSAASVSTPQSRRVAKHPPGSARSCTTLDSHAPPSPRSRLALSPRSRIAAAFAGHSSLWSDSAEDEAAEDEGSPMRGASETEDFAGASVLSSLGLDALSAEERRLTSELNSLSAEERRLRSGNSPRDSRPSKGSPQAALGNSFSKKPFHDELKSSPLSPRSGARGDFSRPFKSGNESPPLSPRSVLQNGLSKGPLNNGRESPLRSTSNWTEITGPELPKAAVCGSPSRRKVPGSAITAALAGRDLTLPTAPACFQERPVLPWEQSRGAGTKPARSNSSTSVGSTAGSRRVYASSDVSSGVGSVGATTMKQKRPGSAPSTRAPTRTSALDIATRCWQEFEGALDS